MNPFNPEKRFWLAVILRAAEDLFISSPVTRCSCGSRMCYACTKAKEDKLIRQNAYSFLFHNSPMICRHRKFVFENAGVNLKYHKWPEIRKQADEFELNIEDRFQCSGS